MKKNTHPNYQKVLFIDSASGHRFVCGSSLKTDAKEKHEGEEYPVVYLSISSTSHPFFTGSKQLVDSEGRVEKFKKRFGRKNEAPAEVVAESVAEVSEPVQKEKAAEKKAPEKVAEKKAPEKAAKAKKAK